MQHLYVWGFDKCVCCSSHAAPSYIRMPDGRYKPVLKEEETKPEVIRPKLPKKKAVVMQPAYTKVSTALSNGCCYI